jgi:hypothetical protein
MSTGIRDEYSGFMEPQELGFEEELSARLRNWVSKYERITPLDESERMTRRAEIKALDEEGLGLARTIQKALGETAKVSYFSEGLLKRISVDHPG